MLLSLRIKFRVFELKIKSKKILVFQKAEKFSKSIPILFVC